jgi:hypothetical protein
MTASATTAAILSSSTLANALDSLAPALRRRMAL